ncbi:MAG: hypothetical protein OK455_03025 [Thaumarchaeota archaeon]|nr:hypothetical protein [Nitrososphaerota archaeon]
MGKVDKGVACSITGCKNKGERSMGRDQLVGSGLAAAGDAKRVYLCHEHYKVWKKSTKKEREMQRARWG